MITACWSVKGGAGATVVAAGLALASARGRDPVLLVDLAGDLPATLGVPEPQGPGVAEWLAAGAAVPPDALARLETPVVDGLGLVHRGQGPLGGDAALLVQVLSASGRSVVVDCGTLPLDSGASVAAKVAAEATRSLLVVRNCYLAARRATRAPLCPTGIVVVRESGRVLRAEDMAETLGVPVVASVALDPAVARSVDSGLVVSRLPRSFLHVMAEVA